MRNRGRLAVGVAGGALALIAVTSCTSGEGVAAGAAQGTASRRSSPVAVAAGSTAPSTAAPHASAPQTTATSSPARPSAPHPSAARTAAARLPVARVAAADAAIARLTSRLGAGGVSIEVLDRDSGATFRYGATGGMLSGSIAKLYILEVLLRQQHGRALDPTERSLAVRMIENSDNEAADDLYVRIGQGPALGTAAAALGIHHTVPGPGIYWGFNQTAASDYIALLDNLVTPGPLDAKARRFARELMADVEPDQRWGVSAAADAGTLTRQKNGWLSAAPDNYRWLVNSVGIITAHGRTLLVAVLTQHGPDFASGITLVEQLTKISVRAVTG